MIFGAHEKKLAQPNLTRESKTRQGVMRKHLLLCGIPAEPEGLPDLGLR